MVAAFVTPSVVNAALAAAAPWKMSLCAVRKYPGWCAFPAVFSSAVVRNGDVLDPEIIV